MTPTPAWIDQLDLTPPDPWHRMGTRNFDPAAWPELEKGDEERRAEKQRLIAERPAEVFAALDGTEPLGSQVLRLVVDGLARHGCHVRPQVGLHPLDAAGRLVADDLCVLAPGPTGHRLVAAGVCFPAHWRLSDKLGADLDAIHAPVPRYDVELRSRVNRFFERLEQGSGAVRHNWFFHADDRLFAPSAPRAPARPTASEVASRLWLRSERQTFVGLDGGALFAIRTRQARLDELRDRPETCAALAAHLRAAPTELVAHRGASWCVGPMLEWLDARAG